LQAPASFLACRLSIGPFLAGTIGLVSFASPAALAAFALVVERTLILPFRVATFTLFAARTLLALTAPLNFAWAILLGGFFWI
jgi:hypothetical protein